MFKYRKMSTRGKQDRWLSTEARPISLPVPPWELPEEVIEFKSRRGKQETEGEEE